VHAATQLCCAVPQSRGQQGAHGTGHRFHRYVYRGLEELIYPFHDQTVMVTRCGRICFKGRKVNLSHVFAGQSVGVTQVGERIWLVTFMHYDLGYFDDETLLKTLYPVLREIPNSVHNGFIFSPSNRRATNRSRSSMT
jgi:hypothetical protein